MFSFPATEEEILKLWTKNSTFETSHEKSSNRPTFTFYDGPPFATGLPHYGHILASTIKDTVGRYFYQQGFHVERKFGWDCHGLPVEYEIDKREKISDRNDVYKMGIKNYNTLCRSIVDLYTDQWEDTINRLGRWVSFNGYKTMDTTFMQSVWRTFHALYEKGMIYRGYRVMPFSTACCTPVSNFEANQNYQEVDDPSIVIKFELSMDYNELINKTEVIRSGTNENDFKSNKLYVLVWTTTPWTLISNCAVLVDPEGDYVMLNSDGENYILLKERIGDYFNVEEMKQCCEKEIKVCCEKETQSKKETNLCCGKEIKNQETQSKKKKKSGIITHSFKGKTLLNLTYTPLFNYFPNQPFKILPADFIQKDTGTGLIHCAPGFGEDDYLCFVSNNLIKMNEKVPCPVDEKGKFVSEIEEFKGRYVKDCDNDIILNLKSRNILFHRATIRHRYPFCWRSDTPLLYKLVPSFFVHVSSEIPILLENNEKINWVPANIKYKKFHNWLVNAKDWAVSRNRFWGTPIPIWESEDGDFLCVKDIEDLEEKSGTKVFCNLKECSCKVSDDYGCNDQYDLLNLKKESGCKVNDDHGCNDHLKLKKECSCKVNDDYGCNDHLRQKDNLQNKKKFNKGHSKNCVNKNTDIHRENIDHIKITHNNKVYTRTEEVLDCWFESGSMPFCSTQEIPADFIAEGIDQTRGWFYTLHCISSILKRSNAFKNVITTGIVLAEDGKKMSKRLKNYPDPMEIINEFGSDSLRIALINSPVVVGENLRFSKERVKEIFKMVMIPWYNILQFYLTSIGSENEEGDFNEETEHEKNNEYEKELEHEKDPEHNEKNPGRNEKNPEHDEKNFEHDKDLEHDRPLILDAWIKNRLNKLLIHINSELHAYKLNTVLSNILEFIDDLSNWYVRMHRNEIRRGRGCLKEILEKFSIMMGPFMPFFSKYCYQSVKNGSGSFYVKNIVNDIEKLNINEKNTDAREFTSVHFNMFPEQVPDYTHAFDSIKKIIIAIRSLREQNKLSLKTPLRSALIITEKEIKTYSCIIKKECNLLGLDFDIPNHYKFKEVIKPNFKNISGDKKKIEIIRKLSKEDIKDLLSIGKIQKEETEIVRDDILYEKSLADFSSHHFSFVSDKSKDNKFLVSKSSIDFTVVLNTKLDDELLEMKDGREFWSFLQKMRKNLGLKMEEKRKVYIGDEKIKKIVEKYYGIEGEKLPGENFKFDGKENYPYEGKEIEVILFK